MKKFLGMFIVLVLCFLIVLLYTNVLPLDNATELEEKGSLIHTVDMSDSFAIDVGDSWNTTFTTDETFEEDYNALKIAVTDFAGETYKMIVTGNDEYSNMSADCSVDDAFTAADVKSNVTYTVHVVNTGAEKISGNVEIIAE